MSVFSRIEAQFFAESRFSAQERIDHQLARAGWAIGSRRLIEELKVLPAAEVREPTGDDEDSYEFVDYALMDRLDRPLAIVEAKRSSRDALEGERQAADYADAIRAEHGTDPFIFLANGDEIWFWHRRLYPPRKVSGFFNEDDLLRFAHLDRFGKPLTGAMPLARIIDRAYQPHAEEIHALADSDEPWKALDDDRIKHLSRTIAPLLRFAAAGSYPELQFENQTEQLALARLKADAAEIGELRQCITEHLALLPTDLPEIRPHLAAIAATRTDAFWERLSCPRTMTLQETFAPLMRFRNRRSTDTFVRLCVPDKVQRRHWILYGPSGEGAFADTYRARVEARVRDLAGDNPAMQRLRQLGQLNAEDIQSIAAALRGPDLFITEERLREAYQQPDASLADFLRHILDVAKLPSRETAISRAFDDWVRRHHRLTATQLLFVRTLRKAVMQKAEVSSLDALRGPPFSTIGDPETLFDKPEFSELFDLIEAVAA